MPKKLYTTKKKANSRIISLNSDELNGNFRKLTCWENRIHTLSAHMIPIIQPKPLHSNFEQKIDSYLTSITKWTFKDY